MCARVAWAAQVRAWDWGKPLLVAPAMNTFMWDSPFTAQQLAVLSGLGAHVVPPVGTASSQQSRFWAQCHMWDCHRRTAAGRAQRPFVPPEGAVGRRPSLQGCITMHDTVHGSEAADGYLLHCKSWLAIRIAYVVGCSVGIRRWQRPDKQFCGWLTGFAVVLCSPFAAQTLCLHLQLKELRCHAQVSKALACGDVGLGAMAAPQAINDAAREAMGQVSAPGECGGV